MIFNRNAPLWSGLQVRVKLKVCPSDETNKGITQEPPRLENQLLKRCSLNAAVC